MKKIKTAQDFANFYRNDLSDDEFKIIKQQIGVIKTYLENKGLIGDLYSVKMDDKDFPLSFYHEAGEILPVEDAITRSLKGALANPAYADAMWGTLKSKKLGQSVTDYFKNAQIRGVATALGFRAVESTEVAGAGITGAANRLRERLDAQPNSKSAALLEGAHGFVARLKKAHHDNASQVAVG